MCVSFIGYHGPALTESQCFNSIRTFYNSYTVTRSLDRHLNDRRVEPTSGCLGVPVSVHLSRQRNLGTISKCGEKGKILLVLGTARTIRHYGELSGYLEGTAVGCSSESVIGLLGETTGETRKELRPQGLVTFLPSWIHIASSWVKKMFFWCWVEKTLDLGVMRQPCSWC